MSIGHDQIHLTLQCTMTQPGKSSKIMLDLCRQHDFGA
jgi:hypothetical protein